MVKDEVRRYDLERKARHAVDDGEYADAAQIYNDLGERGKAREMYEKDAEQFLETGQRISGTADTSKMDPQILINAGYSFERAGKLIKAWNLYQDAMDKGAESPSVKEHIRWIESEFVKRKISLEDLDRIRKEKRERRESASAGLAGKVAAMIISIASLIAGMSMFSSNLAGRAVAELSPIGANMIGIWLVMLGLLLGMLLLIKKKE